MVVNVVAVRMFYLLVCLCSWIHLCHSILSGELNNESSTKYYSICILENLQPRSLIFRLDGDVNNLSVSEEDKVAHFFCDTNKPEIYISTFLNFDEKHEYILHLQWNTANFTNFGVLNVMVEDVADWPPVFNESCAFQDLKARTENDLVSNI
ncbi:uncharacterized protein LOC102809651 [Saccoglossus kowalevskii]|uniref:Uncharacterized protein LOC102809651 n=1 Tax=Saccoglossus kowalevskii TaxID=10224 RepID=A0ABM0MML5_SACKO|nr:PREDICTED: uncharacterized protein LOC102809651 [Saccoglossus kowalevskii]